MILFVLDFSPEAQSARARKRWGNPETRFWNCVDKTPGHGPKGDCWLWLGALQGNKLYGVVRNPINQKMTTAHRVAFYFANGYINEDLLVCHECDFGLCVNPKHLWQGTIQNNVDDRCIKGRSRTNITNRLRDELGRFT